MTVKELIELLSEFDGDTVVKMTTVRCHAIGHPIQVGFRAEQVDVDVTGVDWSVASNHSYIVIDDYRHDT